MIAAFYIKNYVMFGELIPGQVYKKMNYADMVQQQAPEDAIERLTREGRIGRILEIPAVETRTDRYAEFVRQPTPRGIPLLDMREKTTGVGNWHSAWTAKIADLYYRDAQVVARECPGLPWLQIRENLRTYLLPATNLAAFENARNATRLRPFLNWYERITSGEFYVDTDSDDDPIAWLNVFLLPACLAGGLVIAVRTFSKCGGRTSESRARCATILFLLFNIVYDSAITIVFSSGDHNRYREEVAPLYAILLGVLSNALWIRLRALRRAANPANGRLPA
jgi:hypothetical protein